MEYDIFIKFCMIRTFTILLCLGVTFLSASPDPELKKIEKALQTVPIVKSPKVPQILVYSKASGFAHKSIPTGVKALRALARKTGAFNPEFSQSVEDFTAENLKKFDGLIFNNCTRVEKAFVSQKTAKCSFKFYT